MAEPHSEGPVHRPQGDEVLAAPAAVTRRFRALVAVAGDDRRMRLELDAVELWADDRHGRCSTTIQVAGAYVVVVASVVISRDV